MSIILPIAKLLKKKIINYFFLILLDATYTIIIMKQAEFPDQLAEKLLRNFTIIRIPGSDPDYKTYLINLDGSTFQIRKKQDLILISSDVVQKFGDEVMSCIGCYIDHNLI